MRFKNQFLEKSHYLPRRYLIEQTSVCTLFIAVFFPFLPQCTVHLLLYVVLLVVKIFFKEILYSLWSNIRKFLCNSIPNIKSMQLRSLMRKKWSLLFGEASGYVRRTYLFYYPFFLCLEF